MAEEQAEVAHLVEHPHRVVGTKVGMADWYQMKLTYCGSSSFGRARPCQGRGGRFEPGLPLQKGPVRFPAGIFFDLFFLIGALVVELVDTQDLKSCSQQCECGFNSRPGHGFQPISDDRFFCGYNYANTNQPAFTFKYPFFRAYIHQLYRFKNSTDLSIEANLQVELFKT